MDEVGVTGGGNASVALDGHHDGCVLVVPVCWPWVRLDGRVGGLVNMLAFNIKIVQCFCQEYP